MSEPPDRRRVSKVQVILNPVSGISRRASPADTIRDVLRAGGIESILTPTEAPGHATVLARQACSDGMDAVVAVGGDGTLSEVLNGLEDPSVALASVPMGTSNMLARELRIPFESRAAVELVVAGRRRRLDVGVVNGRRYLMVVGVGWDAHVVNAVAGARKGHLGYHRYFAPIARSLFDYDFPPVDVYLDDEPEPRRASLVFACNTRVYASWFKLAPRALPDDGLLDFVLVGKGGARDYLRWAIGAYMGTLPRYREVEYRQATRLKVVSDRPVPVQVDGDPAGTTPISITIEPGALEVFVP